MADASLRAEPVNESNLLTEEELGAKAKELQKGLIGSIISILPIEYSRIIVMTMAFFLIAFTYTFLRLYKDNVIYSVLEPSAQNWLKLFTFVASLISVGVIQKLLVFYDMDKVFEVMTISFGVLLLVMAFLINYRDSVIFGAFRIQKEVGWAESIFIEGVAESRSIGALYVITLIFNHWVLSLFYVLCEVIGSIMVSYLFLTYVNTHCTQEQNNRFMRILYIFSNIAGWTAAEVYDVWNNSMKGKDYELRERFYVYFTFGAVAIFGLILVLKRVLDRIFANPIVVSSGKVKKVGKAKRSVSILDGIYYAFVSKLLLSMCAMTLFYNISANLLTSLFTNSLSAAANILGVDKSAFGTKHKAMEMKWTAGLVIVVMLTPFAKLFEWFGAASSGGVPIAISLAGAIASTVFAVRNFPALGEDNMKIVSYWNDAERWPMGEVYTNLVTSSAVKISKYAFFDIIKEAISMKINPEIRPLFKGVYDGVCGKLGKFTGAIYGIVMEIITGQRDARYYAPVTCVIIMSFCLLWTVAIYYLHYSFKNASKKDTYMSPDYFEGFKLKDE